MAVIDIKAVHFTARFAAKRRKGLQEFFLKKRKLKNPQNVC